MTLPSLPPPVLAMSRTDALNAAAFSSEPFLPVDSSSLMSAEPGEAHQAPHLKHEAGWTITRTATGTTQWTAPTGHRYHNHPTTIWPRLPGGLRRRP